MTILVFDSRVLENLSVKGEETTGNHAHEVIRYRGKDGHSEERLSISKLQLLPRFHVVSIMDHITDNKKRGRRSELYI